VLPRLAALVRHGLIRTERPQLPGEDAFRFRHLLLRDAAYEALPKAVRADLHGRFADWLEDKAAVVELDELLGYHLEQAARYGIELGRPDPAVALRAGDRLVVAGVRALGRDDERAAAGLLERALTLTRPLRLDVQAELDLAQALWHDPEQAARIAERAALRAGEAGDETGEALARAIAVRFRLTVTPGPPDELESLLLDARRRLDQAEDHVGLMYVWSSLGYVVASMRGRYDGWAAASEQALHHSRLAGRSVPPATNLGVSLIMGSRPVDEALETVDRLLDEVASSWLLCVRAWLLAMLDRTEEAWQDAHEAAERLRDQSLARWCDWTLAELSSLAGDHEAASTHLRIVCDWLEATDGHSHLSTYLPLLGRSLCMLGRFDEAEQLAKRGRALDDDDPMTQVYVCQVLARVHVHRGELAEAERLAREAVAESERTDSLNMQAEALCDLGEALAAAGRPDDAEAALEQALDRCERKKNLALARHVRERLVKLRAGRSARAAGSPD
jgi:tetratricopeptide (TPR) repeat protein